MIIIDQRQKLLDEMKAKREENRIEMRAKREWIEKVEEGIRVVPSVIESSYKASDKLDRDIKTFISQTEKLTEDFLRARADNETTKDWNYA